MADVSGHRRIVVDVDLRHIQYQGEGKGGDGRGGKGRALSVNHPCCSGHRRIVVDVDVRYIQYQGETLPPGISAFHLVLGKFHIQSRVVFKYVVCVFSRKPI